MSDTLQPLEPGEAVAMFIASREDELAERTLELHEEQLRWFLEWCSSEGVRNMNEVSARTIHRYRQSIKEGWAQSTLSIHFGIIRQFIRFCESIDGVASGVAEKIEIPNRDD